MYCISKFIKIITIRRLLKAFEGFCRLWKGIVNKNGRAEAEEGYHDDLVMALAISYYIRTQQTYNKLSRNPKYDDLEENINKIFGNEEKIEVDYGDDIVPF